jgi:hypothetical protein
MDLVLLLGIAGYFINRNPQLHTASYSSSLLMLVVAFAVFLLVDFTASALAVGLERCSADRWNNVRLLAHVWPQRLAYRPLFSLVILRTLKRVIEGYEFSWGKLERTAALQCHFEQGPLPQLDEDVVSAMLGNFDNRSRPFAIRVMAEGTAEENP